MTHRRILFALVTSAALALTACGPGGMTFDSNGTGDLPDDPEAAEDSGSGGGDADEGGGDAGGVGEDSGPGTTDPMGDAGAVEDTGGSGGEDAAVEPPGPMCGDGTRDPGETCDGDCPASCDDRKSCTSDSSTGSAQMCDLVCQNDPITACQDGDGCCAPGCNANDDDDCAIDCTDPAQWPPDWVAFESEVVRLVNIERAQGANCDSEGTFAPAGAVTEQAHLSQSARCHSLDMATQNYFSHTGLDNSRFWERISDTGYSGNAVGENIAVGQSSPAAVVSGWMDSDGHCANIMRANAREIGIGYIDDALIDQTNDWRNDDWPHVWTMVTGR